MSRVAKSPITIEKGVDVKIDGQQVEIKGPQGTLTQSVNKLVEVTTSSDNSILCKPIKENQESWAQAGTARANIKNMITGVTSGFSKTLELVGVGFRAQVKGSVIELSLGFSHPVAYQLPEGITAESPSNTQLIIKGMDKQAVGQTAAKIRGYRKPEPYKGKGIKYSDEIINRKEAKKK